MECRSAILARLIRRLTLAASTAALLGGCGPDGGQGGTPEQVPVEGTITIDGQPLEGAVVTFLQTGEGGTTGLGESDEDGKYSLSARMTPGVAPGPYKVGISYQQAPSGRVVGLALRSSLAPVADVYQAKELLPAKYSDLGRTILEATVPAEGGTFDFDLEGPLLEPPPPPPDAEAPDEDLPAPADDGSDAEQTVPSPDGNPPEAKADGTPEGD